MNASNLIRADILALDANDEPVMLVKVRAIQHIDQTTQDTVVAGVQDSGIVVRYIMFVDLQEIRLFNWDSAKLTAVFQVPTAQVLSHYDDEFGGKRVFDYYLTKLVAAWLHDLAYQWKSSMPPCYDELTQLGFVELLRGGATLTDVNLQSHAFLAA